MADGRSFVTNEIKAAFLDLMREKSYMDITVSDVVKRAKIARMSFYRKFKSVSDVLDSVSEDAFSKFSENALPAFNGNDPKVLREFLFSFLYFFKKTMSMSSSRNSMKEWLKRNKRSPRFPWRRSMRGSQNSGLLTVRYTNGSPRG